LILSVCKSLIVSQRVMDDQDTFALSAWDRAQQQLHQMDVFTLPLRQLPAPPRSHPKAASAASAPSSRAAFRVATNFVSGAHDDDLDHVSLPHSQSVTVDGTLGCLFDGAVDGTADGVFG
jgi:hypothetical protein